MKFLPAACLLMTLWAGSPQAGGSQREMDYADYLRQTVPMEQGIWLGEGGQSFFALLTEAEKSDHVRAVLLLHDMGEHPDQKPIMHGLRGVLPQHNWTTLSIQLPVREAGAGRADYYGLFDEAHGRIQTAVRYLRKIGAKDIAVVGHGMGAAMAAYSLSLDPNGLAALALVSLAVPDSSLPQAQTGEFIRNIALPILDLYAEFDLPEVVDTARRRRMLGKDNPVYRQVRMNGENHAFAQDPNLLIKRIYSWLALSLGPN